MSSMSSYQFSYSVHTGVVAIRESKKHGTRLHSVGSKKRSRKFRQEYVEGSFDTPV